jgi:hypothetical protein
MANGRYTSEGQNSEASTESTVEVDELDPEAVTTEGEQEAAGAHTSISYTIPTASTQDGGNGEGSGDEFGIDIGPFSISFETGDETGEESQFETVEGWDESFLTEAGAADEAKSNRLSSAPKSGQRRTNRLPTLVQ